MDSTLRSSNPDLAPAFAHVAAGTHEAVADDPGSGHGEPVIASPDANRDNPDVVRHHPSELHVSRVYVHRHSPTSVEVIPWRDTPLGDAA